MMNESVKTLLTIITEASLENTLAREIEKLGAKGYTITEARGKGKRGARGAEWDADRNIRIEVICAKDIGEKIAKEFQDKYFDNFAMVIYSTEVKVLRSDKF